MFPRGGMVASQREDGQMDRGLAENGKEGRTGSEEGRKEGGKGQFQGGGTKEDGGEP